MITLSIVAVLVFLAKVAAVVCIAGFSAIWFMWPINDKPTSKTQVVMWVLFQVLVGILMFTDLIIVSI